MNHTVLLENKPSDHTFAEIYNVEDEKNNLNENNTIAFMWRRQPHNGVSGGDRL